MEAADVANVKCASPDSAGLAEPTRIGMVYTPLLFSIFEHDVEDDVEDDRSVCDTGVEKHQTEPLVLMSDIHASISTAFSGLTSADQQHVLKTIGDPSLHHLF